MIQRETRRNGFFDIGERCSVDLTICVVVDARTADQFRGVFSDVDEVQAVAE